MRMAVHHWSACVAFLAVPSVIAFLALDWPDVGKDLYLVCLASGHAHAYAPSTCQVNVCLKLEPAKIGFRDVLRDPGV